LLALCVVSLDLMKNSWIEDVEFKWWNSFTTGHYVTWLFVKDENLWWRFWVFFALPQSVSIAAMLFDFAAGIFSILLITFVFTPILLVIEKRIKKKLRDFENL
ncbi:MAG: hypothetical protein ACE5KD_03680, partial [Candidatus Bathyarchaeia archaeon]